MRAAINVSLASLALLACSSVLPAQTKEKSPKTAHTGDLTGVWYPSSVNTFNFIWTNAQGQTLSVLPLTPWGQERIKGNHPIGGEYTALTSNDPNNECLPPGVPNIYTHAYPIEVLEVPGRTILFFEYMHIVRQIFTDGRAHPEDANPTWMGDSIGNWEGDTLVVDSTGFNDKTWLDVSGHPHSEALHVVERMHRPDHDTLLIDISARRPAGLCGDTEEPAQIHFEARLEHHGVRLRRHSRKIRRIRKESGRQGQRYRLGGSAIRVIRIDRG